MKRIEKDYGYLILDDENRIFNYEGGSTCNGTCYKDIEAFKTGKGICYISEYGLKDLHEDLDFKGLEGEDRAFILGCHGYSRQDILDLLPDGEVFIKVAEYIFYTCDWQYPETLLDDMIREYEADDWAELGLTEDDINELRNW